MGPPTSEEEHAQNDSDNDDVLLMWLSLPIIGYVPASLANETMPWRQSGHAIKPGGPWARVELLFVEQRYRAHRVQNSWEQPAQGGVYIIICL